MSQVMRKPVPIVQVVECPLPGREVTGFKPGRWLKMVPLATLLDAQHYKASFGFSHKYRTTNIA